MDPWNLLIVAKLDLLACKVECLTRQVINLEKLVSQLDDKITALQGTVSGLTTVVSSAVALISGIGQQITDAVNAALAAGATPVQLQGLTDLTVSLDAQKQALADAVAANTPPSP